MDHNFEARYLSVGRTYSRWNFGVIPKQIIDNIELGECHLLRNIYIHNSLRIFYILKTLLIPN